MIRERYKAMLTEEPKAVGRAVSGVRIGEEERALRERRICEGPAT